MYIGTSDGTAVITLSLSWQRARCFGGACLLLPPFVASEMPAVVLYWEVHLLSFCRSKYRYVRYTTCFRPGTYILVFELYVCLRSFANLLFLFMVQHVCTSSIIRFGFTPPRSHMPLCGTAWRVCKVKFWVDCANKRQKQLVQDSLCLTWRNEHSRINHGQTL